MRNKTFGTFGGRVLRATRVGTAKKIRGAILTPDETQAMPMKNRVALFNAGKIDFFPDPESLKIAPVKTVAQINQEKMDLLVKTEKNLETAEKALAKAQSSFKNATKRVEKAKTPAAKEKAQTAFDEAMTAVNEKSEIAIKAREEVEALNKE